MSRTVLQIVGEKDIFQRIWERIQHHEGEFTVADVIGDDDAKIVRKYLIRLENGGYISLTRSGRYISSRRWCLTKKNGAEAPRLDKNGQPDTDFLAIEQIWRTLRMQKADITAHALATFASTKQVVVTEAQARIYLQKLLGAGYVLCIRDRYGFGRPCYRLISNTGPRPPEIRINVTLFDPNLNSEISLNPDITS